MKRTGLNIRFRMFTTRVALRLWEGHLNGTEESLVALNLLYKVNSANVSFEKFGKTAKLVKIVPEKLD